MAHEVKDLSREELTEGLNMILQELKSTGGAEHAEGSASVKVNLTPNAQQ